MPDYATPTTTIPDSAYLSPTTCPYTTNPTATAQGTITTANMHVPGRQDSTTWNRFFWVIQYAVGQVGSTCTAHVMYSPAHVPLDM